MGVKKRKYMAPRHKKYVEPYTKENQIPEKNIQKLFRMINKIFKK
jgi:hypothetical protein